MAISREERDAIAENIERYLNRAASSVRSRIKAGYTFEEAADHQIYWTRLIEEEAAKLHNAWNK